jgi:Tfp pilus assembly protein FimT
MRSNTGAFTLIELIVVISITMILTGGALVRYSAYAEQQRVVQAGQNFASNLELARSKALTGEKPPGCTTLTGYQVISDSTTVYHVSAVCTNATYTISTVTTGRGTTIVPFPPITFEPLTYGTSLASDTSIVIQGSNTATQYLVQVTTGGGIEKKEYSTTSAPTPTKILSTPVIYPTVAPAMTGEPTPTPFGIR